MGCDQQVVCQKPTPKADQLISVQSPQAQDGGSSDEEEEEEELGTGAAAPGEGASGTEVSGGEDAEGAKPQQATEATL